MCHLDDRRRWRPGIFFSFEDIRARQFNVLCVIFQQATLPKEAVSQADDYAPSSNRMAAVTPHVHQQLIARYAK